MPFEHKLEWLGLTIIFLSWMWMIFVRLGGDLSTTIEIAALTAALYLGTRAIERLSPIGSKP